MTGRENRPVGGRSSRRVLVEVKLEPCGALRRAALAQKDECLMAAVGASAANNAIPTFTDRIDRRATAYHEAGHAVAHFVLGRRIDRVTITEHEDTLGHVRGRILKNSEMLKAGIGEFDTLRETKAVQDAIVAALAGPIAETRLIGHRNQVGAAGDDEIVADLVEALHGDGEVAVTYLLFTEAQARQLIDDYWFFVEALAEALLERRLLSGSAAHRIIQVAIRAEADRLGGLRLFDFAPERWSPDGWRGAARLVAVVARDQAAGVPFE